MVQKSQTTTWDDDACYMSPLNMVLVKGPLMKTSRKQKASRQQKLNFVKSFLEGLPSVPGSKVAILGNDQPTFNRESVSWVYKPVRLLGWWYKYHHFFLNSYWTKPPRSRTPKGCGYYTLQTGSYLQFLGPSAMHREGYLVGCIDRQEKMTGHTIRSHRISRSKISSNRMRKK